MKNQKITISVADINSSTGVVTNCGLLTQGADPTQSPSSPKRFWFKNSTGADITFNVLSSIDELKEYKTSSTNFVGVPVLNSTTFDQAAIFGKESFEVPPMFVVVKKLSGTASSTLDIYCLNYV